MQKNTIESQEEKVGGDDNEELLVEHEMRLMQQLGLPTSFGKVSHHSSNNKQRKVKSKQSTYHEEEEVLPEVKNRLGEDPTLQQKKKKRKKKKKENVKRVPFVSFRSHVFRGDNLATFAWTKHETPDGTPYYFNASSQVSTYTAPDHYMGALTLRELGLREEFGVAVLCPSDDDEMKSETRTVRNDDVVDDDITNKSLEIYAGKYWPQRYALFSKFDEGIELDTTGFFSVTPEAIAIHIAERCRCSVLIDAFCGGGGNAIQFAMTCERVIAIDIDAERLLYAKHNARIYGVEDRIEFVLGDFVALAPGLKADVVFLGPPWGGPEYKNHAHFDLQTMIQLRDPTTDRVTNGVDLYHVAKRITPHLAYLLPAHTRPEQIVSLTSDSCEVELAHIRGKPRMLTAYYGELVI